MVTSHPHGRCTGLYCWVPGHSRMTQWDDQRSSRASPLEDAFGCGSRVRKLRYLSKRTGSKVTPPEYHHGIFCLEFTSCDATKLLDGRHPALQWKYWRKNSYLLLSGWRGQCFHKEPVPCSGRSRFCPTDKHNGMNAELLWSLSNVMLNKRRWCGDNWTSPAEAVSSTLFCFIVGWWLPETTEAFLSLSTTWITPELLFALCLAAFRWQEHPERNRRQERGTDSLRIPTQLCTWKGMRLCGIWTL